MSPQASSRLLACGIILGVSCVAGASAAVPATEVHLAGPAAVPSGGELSLRVDGEAWAGLWRAGSARVMRFPLADGLAVDLDVVSFDLLGPDARFLFADHGDVKEAPGPSMRFFRGAVAGEPDSLVSLNLFGGRIAGFVRTKGTEYTFGPRAFAPHAAGADEIVVRDAAAEKSMPEGRCDGDEKTDHDRSLLDLPAAEAITGSTMLLAQVAVEGTAEWVAHHGGVSGAQTYTLNLMSQVSAIYEAEVRVQIQVPYVLMNAAEPDGYSGQTNNTGTILPEMRAKWNGSPTLQAVQRSTVHLFGTYPSGGSGRAYLDVLCDNVPASASSYDYGVTLMDGNGGSWERRMVAHELGHNFSSPHSHCFSPEIDQCNNTETGCYAGTVVQTTGTIMSYCSTRLSTFHQRERDERIRPGAEAAYPSCLQVAGNPGTSAGLDISPAPICGAADLVNDDGAGNGMYGFPGTSRAAWVKRMTPACLPFKLATVDVRISHSSVAVGRPLRLLVYADPAGTGSIADATLVYSQDVSVQLVSASQWNHFTLTSPVMLGGGDYYVGFMDLVADSATNYIMDYDTRPGTDSWYQPESTEPTSFGPIPGSSGSWMIRGHGGGLDPGSVRLTWDPPCNDVAVPGQDFAVYQGMAGSWTSYASLTCSTGHARAWVVENPPSGAFWLVVPQNSLNEGSYGRSSAGVERPPAAAACKPQAISSCP